MCILHNVRSLFLNRFKFISEGNLIVVFDIVIVVQTASFSCYCSMLPSRSGASYGRTE